MILTTHILVGSVIGSQLNSPWTIIPASIIVHYAMDKLRHGEYLNQKSTTSNTLWKVAIDLTIGLLLAGAVLYFKHVDLHQINLVGLGLFFSILPDFFTFIYWKIIPAKFLQKLYEFHAQMHAFPPFSPERDWNLRNARNDILISILAIATLFFRL